MAFQLATKTMNAIATQMHADQGAAFRINSGKILPHMGDAYRGVDEGFRSHLGASMIGKSCARQVWYGFRWAMKAEFSARILRLFNRGHLEEARLIAALLAIGVQVYQQDANGNQYRISAVGGHFGGSGDGVAIGIPDVEPGSPCLLEFKTHGVKSFAKLQKEGVAVAKPEHLVQMNIYMRKMSIPAALYGAVCKDTDEYHFEIIRLDTLLADQFLDRGRQIIMLRTAPARINESPGFWECRFCELKGVCHGVEAPAVNCRTCHWSRADEDGSWRCGDPARINGIGSEAGVDILTKERQLAGCPNYTVF